MEQDEFLQLSGIQHFAFCKRQWGLIHIDGVWRDNDLTASGNTIHSNVVDGLPKEVRRDLRIMRSLRVTSRELKLNGICDVVEVRDLEGGGREVFPVEYKHGRPKAGDCDRVQLCAQAIALEELFETVVEHGAVYYHTIRRREAVPISEELRALTRTLAEEMHVLYREGRVPLPRYGPHCMSCSLYDDCMPELFTGKTSVRRYMTNKRRLIG
jgi:CRISPR-associated exonuclease Cas4